MTNDAARERVPLTPVGPAFTAGLITGGIIGAVLALALAPRGGVNLQRRVAGVARDLGASARRSVAPSTVASPITR